MTQRAVVVTDMVDSTRLAQSLGDERMGRLSAAHDGAARALVAAWRGHEVEKTDGFVLVFESVDDAAGWTLAYQADLTRLSQELGVGLATRAAIDVGDVRLHGGTVAALPLRVEGEPRDAASRIMAVARAGQTLLTARASRLLGVGVRVESHGHWRIPGLVEPVELLELGTDATSWAPPEDGRLAHRVVRDGDLWVPARPMERHLPRERDAFVGRERELAALAELLEDEASFVTITGAAGTGKTRLARRLAWTRLGAHPGGTFFCDLSEARGVDGIAQAVAGALGVALGREDAIDQIGSALAARGRCLVVLDNFEQVSAHAGDTLGRWLERAGETAFVVTSRERLHLPGERVLALEALDEAHAVALFEARARARRPDLALDAADREDVLGIVRLLDGLPLAIELAAARLGDSRPAALRARLAETLDVLADASTPEQRHATLVAAIEWSWDLLEPWEKAALAQASAFAGGFTLEAAEAVLELGAWADAPMSIDVVQSLLDKSLLRVQSERLGIDETYLGMYVSIHQHAAGKLRSPGTFEGSGPDAEDATWRRHGAFFAALGDERSLLELDDGGAAGIDRRARLSAELDNLVVACRRASARGDVRVAVATHAAAAAVLEAQGPLSIAIELGRAVATGAGASPRDRARSGLALATALHRSGSVREARVEYDAALDAARSAADPLTQGRILSGLAHLERETGSREAAIAFAEESLALVGDAAEGRLAAATHFALGLLHAETGRPDDARAHYARSLEVHRRHENWRLEAYVLGNLGNVLALEGRAAEARQHLTRALATHRETGNRMAEGLVLGTLGALAQERGELLESRGRLEEALAIFRSMGTRKYEAGVLSNLGNVLSCEDRDDEARVVYEAALAILAEVGSRQHQAAVMTNIGGLLHHAGRLDEAASRFESALALLDGLADPYTRGAMLGCLGELRADQGRLDEARQRLEEGEALLREVHDAIELAKLLCRRGRVELLAGDAARARSLVEEASALAEEAGAGPESRVAAAIADLRGRLGGQPASGE